MHGIGRRGRRQSVCEVDYELVAWKDVKSGALRAVGTGVTVERISVRVDSRLIGKAEREDTIGAVQVLGFHDGASGGIARARRSRLSECAARSKNTQGR